MPASGWRTSIPTKTRDKAPLHKPFSGLVIMARWKDWDSHGREHEGHGKPVTGLQNASHARGRSGGGACPSLSPAVGAKHHPALRFHHDARAGGGRLRLVFRPLRQPGRGRAWKVGAPPRSGIWRGDPELGAARRVHHLYVARPGDLVGSIRAAAWHASVRGRIPGAGTDAGVDPARSLQGAGIAELAKPL